MKPVVLPELRYRRLWFLCGVAIALVITVVCLVPQEELPEVGLSDKSEHVLAFGALAFWFGSIVVRRDFLWLALSLIAFGGLIELAQGLMGWGRSADLLDVFADSIGVVAGLAAAFTPLGRWTRWLEARLAQAGS